MTSIVIVHAGLSEDSATARLADAISTALAAGAEAAGVALEVRQLSLRPLARSIADHFVTGFANPPLAAALAQVGEADGLVALTPTYQGSYSGLFKSFFDVLPEGVLDGVPVLIGATGGTPRHSLVTEHALRPLFSYLRALVVPTAIFAATQDWGAPAADAREGSSSALKQRIRKAAGQLLAFTGPGTAAPHSSDLARRGAPNQTDPNQTDPEFADLVDFADVLSGLGASPAGQPRA